MVGIKQAAQLIPRTLFLRTARVDMRITSQVTKT
jgi:hypothetical protein